MVSPSAPSANNTRKTNAMTKKIILKCMAVLASLGRQAQQTVKIYKNGQLYKIYNNTSANRYSVVFDTYVKIGDTKWGTMNIGATSVADSPETAYGDYFAWGEVDTYYTSITNKDGEDVITWKSDATNTHIKGEKTGYNSTNYWDANDEWKPSPMDATGTLTSDYDAATVLLDDQWRMPTPEDYNNLFTACGGTDLTDPEEITGTTSISKRGIYHVIADATIDEVHYGVNGILFVADDTDINCRVFFPMAGNINDTSRVISPTTASRVFFPMAGSINDTVGNNRVTYGYYWTSTYDSGSRNQAHCVTMTQEDIFINETQERYMGLTIRPIMK